MNTTPLFDGLHIEDFAPLAEFRAGIAAAEHFIYADSGLPFVGGEASTRDAAFRSAAKEIAGRLWAECSRGLPAPGILEGLRSAATSLSQGLQDGVFEPDWEPARGRVLDTVPAFEFTPVRHPVDLRAGMLAIAEATAVLCAARSAPEQIMGVFGALVVERTS